MAASLGPSDAVSANLSAFPDLTFSEVEAYAQKESGCRHTIKGYKFFAEPGYLHDVKVSYEQGSANITAKCHRSMRKSELPHQLYVIVVVDSKAISGKCSCVAGLGGYCNHVVGLLYYLAHCKQLGFSSLPDDLTCTSMKERWSIPRERKIGNQEVQSVLVKKPRPGANYDRYIKNTLYSPARQYRVLDESHYNSVEPKPLIATIAPRVNAPLQLVSTKFGHAVKGSVISYQQKLSEEYLINNYSCTSFPELPLPSAEMRFENDVSMCLQQDKLTSLGVLSLSRQTAIEVEEKTRAQSQSGLWTMLRNKRITASKFGQVAKRKSNFDNLVRQINPSRHVVTAPMRRGLDLEPQAAFIYASKAKQNQVNLFPSGLVINPKCPWLGCTPDRKVFDLGVEEQGLSPFGLLEIKVVKEGATDFENVAYLTKDNDSNVLKLKRNHDYHYQVQCQLALTGLEWCDFFSYINDTTFFCERIMFDPIFFQTAKDRVDYFFFTYFL